MKTQEKNISYLQWLCFISFLSLLIPFSVIAQPVAAFSASPTTGCGPLVVQFTDNSTGTPTEWKWDLGNGTTSIQNNPTTTYANPGSYTVSLMVTNANGSNTITKTQLITVYKKPVVNFTVSDSADCVPFNTRFTDLSTTAAGSIASWEWDFDDGTTSALQHPQHTYVNPGNYTVTLKVTNSGGCSNILSKQAYVKASDPIVSNFKFVQGIKCRPPETIRFFNNSTAPGTVSYWWNFGDGYSSAAISPSHTYLTSGLYSVSLAVKNNLGCTDTLLFKDTLLIKNVYAAIAVADTVCNNIPVSISNATTPIPLTAAWNFGDGTSTFGNNTTKRWTSPGNFTIQLINNFTTCSDTITKKLVVRNNPLANFVTDFSSSCKSPFTVHFTDLSSGAVSWKWNFGDNTSSTLQNPSHTYTSEGIFDVTLTITDRFGCSTSIERKTQITIARPVVDIDLADGGGCIPFTFAPLPVVTTPDSVTSYFWDLGNGITSTNKNPSTTYTNVGDYTIKLVITTSSGCIDSSIKLNSIKTGTPPVAKFGVDTLQACPGVNFHFKDSSIAADHWLWNFGDGNTADLQDPIHSFGDSGWYNVRLIAINNGCRDTLIKIKYVHILPGLARFIPVYNCTNKNEVFFKDSSNLPQTWFWNFGDGYTSNSQNPVHVFSAYQPYAVSLTTSNSFCTDTRVVKVKPIREIPNFTVSKNAICKNDSIAFYLTGFNKSNILNYFWDYGDGSTDSTGTDSLFHQYKIPGTYSVSVKATDLYGCSESTSKINIIHVYGPLAGFTINAPGGCANKSVNFSDTSNTGGNNNIAQWQWNFGDGQTQQSVPPLPVTVTHTYTNPGNYFPSLKITDSTGCTDSIQYAIPIKITQPLANFFAANPISCINDTVIFRNPSLGVSLTYLWSFGDGSFSTDSIPFKKYTVNGDYNISLTIKDANGCKDSSIKINYIKLRDVAASFTVSDSIGTCLPLPVIFKNTSTNAFFQQWDFGDGTFSSSGNTTHYYTDTGTYVARLTVKRSANNNCVSTATKTIRITAPKATLSYTPTDGCAPLSVSFVVNTQDRVNYTWDFNDGTSYTTATGQQMHDYILPGKFLPKVFLKDSGGCVITLINSDTIKLYSSKVNFGASDTVFCDAGMATFFDSTMSGSAVTSYKWQFGDGSFSNIQNPSHFYSVPGIYNVGLAISTIYGCRDSLMKNKFITVATTPSVAIAGDTAFCGATAVLLNGMKQNTDTATLYWNWDWGNGMYGTGQNPPAQLFSDTGTYHTLLVVSNSAGCADTAFTNIIIHPAAATFAGNDSSICMGNSITLQASGADAYTWFPDITLSCTNCISPVANTQNSTSYFVKGVNIFGCEKTDSIHIDVKKPFHLAGLQPFDSLCAGKSLSLSVSGTEMYSWTPADGLSDATISNPIATPLSNTVYKVTGFDSIHCFADSASIYIKVNPVPLVTAGPDRLLQAGNSVSISPQYSTDVIYWSWDPPAGLSCSSCPFPVASPQYTTDYRISVTNSNGCTNYDNISIWVKCDKSNLFMPNAFTPNNDGLNEVFYPRGNGIFKIISFKIYNRGGILIFQNGNFDANDKTAGWSGLYKGKPALVDNYVYTVDFICSNKEIISSFGNILLLR